MKASRKLYESELNRLHDKETTLELTEHCWAGNDKTKRQKKYARSLAERGLYGTCLRIYDPIAFNLGYNEWRNQ